MAEPLERLREALAGRYALERAVGEGGMATVFAAQDIKHERRVAIKLLKPELAASLGGERFLREIRVAASLQHPNILSLYESGEADGLLYYIMPFVEGESLRDRLNREKQLPIDEAVRIARETADALQFAHGHGVIHRDIKPENILLMGSHVLVADFGIARAVSEAGTEKLTKTGMAVGTPHYMSPEQGVGGEIDGRSDLYSLGCVLYEMLVGQPPFDGPNALAILARHSMEMVPRLHVVRKTVPEELEEIVMCALAKSPADRFATLGEFSETLGLVDLSKVISRTASKPGITGITSARIRARKRRKLLLRGGLAVAALCAVAGGTWWWSRRAPAAAGTAATAAPAETGVAVLYFQNRNPGDSLGYLADGLTEALIAELSAVKGLNVVSRNGVAAYRGQVPSVDSLRKALQVGSIVQGVVAASGDRIRVNVSLTNAITGKLVADTVLERPRGELFALQDDLSKEVSLLLRQQLGQEFLLEQRKEGARNARAWELVQRAQQEAKDADALLADGDADGARARLAHADTLLGEAERADDRWAVPPTQRGWLAYRIGRLAGMDKSANDEWTGIGLRHAERALALAPSDPDARELRGTLRYWRWLLNLGGSPAEADRLFKEAEADLRASVAARETQASAWSSLAHLNLAKGAAAEAKIAAQKAYQYDPYLTNVNATIWRLFQSSFDLADRLEAEKACAEGLRRFPDDNRFIECQLWLFALKDVKPDVPKAWQLLGEYVAKGNPAAREYLQRRGQMLVTLALARAGLADSARAVAVRSRATPDIDPARETALWEAVMRTILWDTKRVEADKDEAIRQLSVFYASNPQQSSTAGKDDSWQWKPLQGDPRFTALGGGR